MPRTPAPCGTNAAYQRHLRKGEPIDEACREAAREYARSHRTVRSRPASVAEPAHDAPQVRCPYCGGREPVEHPFDEVAIRMAHIRHLGRNRKCAVAKLRRK